MVSYWQVGSGSGDRDYSEECIDLGMAFVGKRYWKTMQRVEENDVVVLRKGLAQIVAVGRVVKHPVEDRHVGCGDKEWLSDFVGWDLPAYCYVKWYRPMQRLEEVKGLTQRAIAHVKQPGPQRIADNVLKNRDSPDGQPGKELVALQLIDLKEIRDQLVEEGLDSKCARALVPRLERIQALVNYYYEFSDVREHEARTFLIVPLLSALGWNERRIKIELSPSKLNVKERGNKSIDIACFSRDYTPEDKQENQENCKFLIESKRFSSGITSDAPKQVKEYAEKLPECKMVMVSNGYCYKAFVRNEDGKFSTEPSAYLNLRKTARNYPLNPDTGGALELLKLALPQTWS